MTRRELIELLDTQFYEGFAGRTAGMLISSDRAPGTGPENCSVALLSSFLKDCILGRADLYRDTDYTRTFPRNALQKAEFRAAFLLETLYFTDYDRSGAQEDAMHRRQALENFRPDLYRLVPMVTNESTKRHFSKIIYHDLKRNFPVPCCPADPDSLASSLADWAMAPEVKSAVRIWCLRSLFLLKDRVEWLPGFLDDFIEYLSENPPASVKVWLRRWKTEGLY